MRDNPLTRLVQCGQSLWLDALTRPLLVSGELVALIQQDGISGVTSNLSVLERSVAGSTDYDAAIAALAREGRSAYGIYETLVTDDVRAAADLLLPLYERLDAKDGYVSLDVSPHLARDSAGTMIEARRLWSLVDRPNLLIRIPATWQGVACVRQLVREGINVDATLLFGIPRYRAVAEAYLDGVSERAAHGLPLERVASVAGIFASRIDRLVDPLLARVEEGEGKDGAAARGLRGRAAVACAKAARSVYRQVFSDDRFLALSARGARSQRLLLAGSGGSEEGADEVKYADALIGPETVATMPPETLDAYRELGKPANRLDYGSREAMEVFELLAELGLDLAPLAQQLEDEGVESLVRRYDGMMRNIELKRIAAIT